MEKFYFFNDDNDDREYDAIDFAAYFKQYFTTGIFNNGFIATAENMKVSIGLGHANIEGYRYDIVDDPLVLDLSLGDANNTRIDNIVIRLDLENRLIKSMVVEGVPSSTPIAPDPIRNETTYDLVLYQVKVPAATSSITKDMIKDTRFDNNLCGIVVGTVKEINTTEVFAQYEAYFKKWFDNLRTNLDNDAAGHLQNEIDTVVANVKNLEKNIKTNWYQVGDLFLSFSEQNPGERFGGIWELTAKGRMLVGVDPDDSDFSEVKKESGSKHHKHKTPLFTDSQIGANSPSRLPWNSTQYGIGAGENIGTDTSSNFGSFTVTGSVGKRTGYPYLTSEDTDIFSNITCYIWVKVADDGE